MQEFHFEGCEGRRTLIVGETGSGKTRLVASLLSEAIQKVPADDVSVLDFAPPQIRFDSLKAGGRIAVSLPGIRCHAYRSSDSIRAPRLEGHDAHEVRMLAEHNASITSGFIRSYLSSPTPLLFINDVTIHLHAGDVRTLLEAIGKSRTFVGSAYSGSALEPDHGSGLSKRERELLRRVGRAVDTIIDLPSRRVRRVSAE